MQATRSAFAYEISSNSPDELRASEACARTNIRPDAIVTDRVITFPGGEEKHAFRDYRLGDCFSHIEVVEDGAASFKLIFHVREDADRYWKDIMASILRKLRECGASVRPC